jgi:cytochrome c
MIKVIINRQSLIRTEEDGIMRKFLVCIAVVIAVAALFVACKKKEEVPTAETAETAEVAMEVDVEPGKALFADVNLGTTGKSCESCHPNGGTEGMEMEGMATKPLTGVKDKYPGVFMMMDPEKEVTLAEVINFCIVNPLGGEALAEDSQEMKDLLAYVESL